MSVSSSWTIDARSRHDNFVNGEWRSCSDYAANHNPSDLNDIVGSFAQADKILAQEAIHTARQATESWAMSGIQQRSDILEFVGAELFARRDEVGRILAREEGKTLAEGIGEATRAAQIFRFFAGEALRPGGEFLPSVRPGIDIEIRRESLGVISIITPWNFPIAIPAWKIAPALAYGNCVLFKPASLVPACAWILTEILSRSGLPAGVFNFINGPVSEVSDALLRSHEVDAISFTGSAQTGKTILHAATEGQKKVQLEMGGKNPLIVLNDAELETAAEIALQGAFGSTGQRCTASSRLIIEDAIHDKFVKALEKKMKRFTVGHALDPDTRMGPVADARQLVSVQSYIEAAQKDGATLTFGGSLEKQLNNGFYLQPTLFTDTTPSMSVNREEVFGPIACVQRASDYEEALTLANDTPFGLCASIATRSLEKAHDFKRRIRTGMAMVNLPTAGVDYHVPFGGTKGSSYGAREQGSYAREFYTSVKTTYTAPKT